MLYHDKLLPEITVFVSNKIKEGLSLSKILREMRKEFGEIHVVTIDLPIQVDQLSGLNSMTLRRRMVPCMPTFRPANILGASLS